MCLCVCVGVLLGPDYRLSVGCLLTPPLAQKMVYSGHQGSVESLESVFIDIKRYIVGQAKQKSAGQKSEGLLT